MSEVEDSKAQTIWVQDLQAWLEKIPTEKLETWVERVQEVLAELPGQGLPEEFWPEQRKARTGAEGSGKEDKSDLSPLSDDERDTIQLELEGILRNKDESSRLQALQAIIAQFPSSEPQLLQRALDAALTFETGNSQSQALASVAAQLPLGERQTVLQKALDVALAIADETSRSQALAAVAAQFPSSEPQLLQQALNAALTFVDETSRSQALAAVAAQLPLAERQAVLQRALDTALAFETGDYRSRALKAIITQLPLAERQAVLQRALDTALTIANESFRSQTLQAIIAQLSPSDPQLVQRALDAALTIVDESFRSQTLQAIIAQLSPSDPQLVQRALDAALTIVDESSRSQALAAVAVQLPLAEHQAVLQAALDAALTIVDESSRSQALAAVATRLPLAERQAVLQVALDAALTIVDESSRSQALAAVATRLPSSEPQLLQKALDAALTIVDESSRSQALAAVATRLPSSEPQLLQKALYIALTFEDEYYQSQALAAVVARLPSSEPQLLQRALNAALTIADESSRSQTLAAVVARLPSSEPQLLQRALNAALTIADESSRSQALAAVVARLPSSEPQLLQKALDAALTIADESSRSQALAADAAQLPFSERQAVLQRAIQIALSIENKQHRIRELSGIAFQFTETLVLQCPQNQLSTVLETIPNSKTSADKAKLLSALAPRISPGLFPRALQLIQTEITHPAYQAEGLGNLAPYLPTEQLSEALDLVGNDIPGLSYPTTALCRLIPHLSLIDVKKALAIANQCSAHPDLRTKVLCAIATRLSTPNNLQIQLDNSTLRKQLIQNILEQTQQNLITERSITTVLTALAPSFDSDHLGEISKDKLPKMESEFYYAQFLAALATSRHLTAELLHPFCEQALALQQDHSRTTALSAFIAIYPNKQDFYETVVKLRDNAPNAIRRVDLALILATRPHPKSVALSQLTSDQTSVLRLVREQSREVDKANALIQLAPNLLQSQILEAQSIAQDIQDPYHRAQSLLALAAHFHKIRVEAQRQIATLLDKDPLQHIELLSQFTTTVPEQIPTLLAALNHEDEDNKAARCTYKRRRILIALKPHLPIRLNREIDRQADIGKAPQDLWERSLFVLRSEYRQALKSGSFRNDATLDEDLLNLKDEINALTEMLLMRDLSPPVVVGILGGWGGGKSYIMHLMQTHMAAIRSQGVEAVEAWGLKGKDSKAPDSDRVHRYVGHIYQIKFDVWTYAKANLWASLMQTIFFELDNQITLEKQLQKSGIDPLEQQSGALWQALYQTNDKDRQWFLQNALASNPAVLETWQKSSKIQNYNDQLWSLFASSQAEAIDNLKKVEDQLKEQQSLLQEKRAEIFQNQTKRTLFITTAQTAFNLLNKRLGDSFTQDIQEKVIEKLTTAVKETKKTQTQLAQFNNSIKIDIESVFEEQEALIDFRIIKEFVRKNHVFILLCCLLLLAAILIPLGVAGLKANLLIQALAGLTPLLGAISIAQGLIKKGQAFYNEVKLGLSEYKQQLEQSIQRQLDTDKSFRQINRQVQILEKEVEAKYAAIPTNVYASITEFVSTRLQKGGYQEHLGIMQQVKEDLALLSQQLLPPPANSKEYVTKIQQLQNVFPRGPARVVLYIDDLDRCPPNTVVEVLEAVQLLVKNPLFIAVLAIDERYINRALAQHYKGVLSLQGSPSSSDYLEKIIQIPYRVCPIAEKALYSYLRAQIVIQDGETSGTKFNEFSLQEFNRLITCCQEIELSPRSLKRLTNVYKLYKILSRTRGQRPTPREQQAILTLLAFSSRYPNLMRDILKEIGSYYEEGRHLKEQDSEPTTLASVFKQHLDKCGSNPYLVQDVQKIRHDVTKLVADDLKLNEIRDIFDFVRTFSFVGDIGVDFTDITRG